MGCLKLQDKQFEVPVLKLTYSSPVWSESSFKDSQDFPEFPTPPTSPGVPSHPFAFNGMEKDDEVSGEGDDYGAMFWEYDARVGRRWNVDPKPNPSISRYATFENNPIWRCDPLGDTIKISWFSPGEKQILIDAAATDGDGKNDGVFFLFGHANSQGVEYEAGGANKRQLVMTPERISQMMGKMSKEWQTAMKEGKEITLIIGGCNAGSNDYEDTYFGKGMIHVDKSIAQQISEKYPNVTVIAADGYVGWDKTGSKKVKTKIAGVYNYRKDGGFITFKHGKRISKTSSFPDGGTLKPKTENKAKSKSLIEWLFSGGGGGDKKVEDSWMDKLHKL